MKNSANVNKLNGKNPNSLAAAAIYMAYSSSDDLSVQRTKKDIVDICGSAETTLNSTLKIMQKSKHLLVN